MSKRARTGFGNGKRQSSTQGIIDANRQTEICRNWIAGSCSFGARCAFAHGAHELRVQTLTDLEQAGRIPNATKFRCYPCITWVATGSCPYGTRCVFIHDPRLRGPGALSPTDSNDPFNSNHRPTPVQTGVHAPPSAQALMPGQHSLKPLQHSARSDDSELLAACMQPPRSVKSESSLGKSATGSKDFFYWPDAQHDALSPESLPSCETTYDLCPAESGPPKEDLVDPVGGPQAPVDSSALAMYKIWYSLVDTLQLDGDEHGLPEPDVLLSQQHLPIFEELASGQFEAPDLPLPLLKPTFCKENACSDCYGEGQGIHPVHARPHFMRQHKHMHEPMPSLSSGSSRGFTPQRTVDNNWDPFKPIGPHMHPQRSLFSRLDEAPGGGLTLEYRLMQEAAGRMAQPVAPSVGPPLQNVVYVPVPVPMMPAAPGMGYARDMLHRESRARHQIR